MLHYKTIESNTLELLKKLQAIPCLASTRLVGSFLLKEFTLSEILRFYFQKYPEASIFLASKSLAYYDDAESDPMPLMFSKDTWEQMKNYIASKYDEYEANY